MSQVTNPSIEVGTSGPAPLVDPSLTLGAYLVEVGRRYGHRDAIITPAARWTYAGLVDAAHGVARGLLASGVGTGDRVAVLLPNGGEWVAAVYGVALLGAVPVLLSTFSSVPEQEQALTITDARALILAEGVGGRGLLDDLLAAHPELDGGEGAVGEVDLRGVAVHCLGPSTPRGRVGTWDALVGAGQAVADGEVEALCARVQPSDDGLVMFTSGTSGVPKAVLHGHAAPYRQQQVWSAALGIRSHERIFTTYPFCWSSGFVKSLGAALWNGACLLTLDHFDAGVALRLMARERATMTILPPEGHLDRRLIDHADFATTDLSSIERASGLHLAAALGLPDRWMSTGYGMTETFTLVSSTPAAEVPGVPPGSSGRVLADWTLKIVDPDTGHVVPRGEVGQVKVRGPALMKGYLGRPPGSGFDDDGFFVSPDLAHLDDEGFVHFASRIDDIVRSAGVNVSTMEVERELNALPRVRMAVAVGLPHPTLGQALVACVVPADADLDEAQVLAALRPRLSSYKLPRATVFLEESDLRFTVSQKVQRAPLRDEVARRIREEGRWSSE